MHTTLVVSLLILSVLPARTSVPAREHEVTFRNGDVTLAGTLTMPAGAGPHPAVVMLSGSGEQNRDSEVFGFRPFRIIAEHLAGKGIAVLRYDDRGVGGSTGSMRDSTTEDFAADALEAVRLLRSRSDIQRTRVGLVGHSEGALAAAIAAAKSADVAFLVWMAGNAVPGAEILQAQAAAVTRASGASEEAISKVVTQHNALIAAIKDGASATQLTEITRKAETAQLEAVPQAQRPAGENSGRMSDDRLQQQLKALMSPWMRFFISYDPSTTLRQVRCPVLALFGELDLQVPHAVNSKRLEDALSAGGNERLTITLYPKTNHFFLQAMTGSPAEYATLPKTFVPTFLDGLSSWISMVAPR